MSRVVVEDGMDRLSHRNLLLAGVQKVDGRANTHLEPSSFALGPDRRRPVPTALAGPPARSYLGGAFLPCV